MSDPGSWLLGLGLLALVVGLIVYWLIALVVLIVPTWRICDRAGFSGALALFHLLPGIGSLIVLAVLAFGTWPNGEGKPADRGGQ